MLADKKDHAEEKKENSNQGEEKQDGLPDEEDGEDDVPKHSRIPFPLSVRGPQVYRPPRRPYAAARAGRDKQEEEDNDDRPIKLYHE